MRRPAPLAKLTRPSPAGVLARERLFRVLDRRRRSPLLWISGPPGSGKTTLISSYLESRGSTDRWYQLDAGDADVGTFFYYMGLAAGTGADDDPGLPLFTAEYQGDPGAFARRWFQSLYARLEPPFVLVLDNYHEISSQSALHDVLLHAVAEMPPDGCIVVVSRTGPPAALVRLRASRALELVGWNELKLTRRESDQIVARWYPDLGAHARERLYERTDGWAAGLVLVLDAIDSLGLGGDAPDASAHELVFDYLAGEVFEKFDPRTRDLLLRTAFLPEITPARAAVVAGEPGAADILAELNRSYHFVSLIPGHPEPVFQHHPLLRDFLRTRAQKDLVPATLAAVRRETSALLEAEGAIEDAVAMLREVGDWSGLARLLLAHAPEMLRLGRAETLEHWLEELPDGPLEADPWLTYWRAACRFLTTPRAARLLYERAYEQFAAAPVQDRRGLLLACSGALDAIIHELDDFSLLDRWIATLGALMSNGEPIPWADVEARASVSMFMALVFRQPHHPDMVEWAERAFKLSGAIPDANTRLSAQLLIAINLNYTGQFARVRDLIDRMRRACESPHVPPLELTVLKSVESMYSMLTADHDACLAAMYDGVEIARASGVQTWNSHLLSNGVAAALGAGDLDTAAELLGQMRECSDKARRLDLCIHHYYTAWRATLAGDLVQAHAEARTALKLAAETGCPFYEVLCRLGLAQVLAECGDEDRAATLLRQVRRAARGIDNRLLEFTCLMTYAHVAFTHGRERAGRAALRSAMRLGREHGFRHHLWWRADVAARLCDRALAAGIEPEYARHLVRERGLSPPDPARTSPRWPWPFRIRSFGGFRMEKDDRALGALAKVQQKPLEVLRVLVGYGADAVRESIVAETMYPRIDGDYAHRSLTTALHRLRKLLGEDRVVLLRHGRLTLNPEFCWLDVRAFEQRVAEADGLRRMPAGRERTVLADGLADGVLGLYRGPFMEGETERPHYVPMRERLRNRFVRCVGELARCFEEADEWERAVDLYRRALDADALAEGFYRRLMLCLRELGRHAEAIETFESCRRTFRAELEADPSPETTAVYQSLVGQL